MLWVYLVALLSVVLDQVTKRLVELQLKPLGDVPLIDGVLHLTYTENTGAAFGMLSGARWFFIIAAALAVIGICIYLARRATPLHRLEMLSLGLIMGGAVGNLIDRVLLKYVTDFIYVKAINFAIFNGADSCVSVGAVLLCIYILFYHDKYMKGLQPAAAPEEPDGEKAEG
jgi:signal peptidase II